MSSIPDPHCATIRPSDSIALWLADPAGQTSHTQSLPVHNNLRTWLFPTLANPIQHGSIAIESQTYYYYSAAITEREAATTNAEQ